MWLPEWGSDIYLLKSGHDYKSYNLTLVPFAFMKIYVCGLSKNFPVIRIVNFAALNVHLEILKTILDVQ